MLELRLLGGLAIDGSPAASDGAARRRRALALLALVAASAPHAIGREKLLGFLWPESDAERARNSLRQELFALRRDLGEGVFLPETAGGIQLDPGRVTVDLWLFRDAMARKAFDEAAAAYGGPFLDGFDIPGLPELSRWVEDEREALRRQFLEALESLARDAAAAGLHDEAVRWRRRQVVADPLSARATLALLQALSAAGDRAGALQHASVYERLVRAQLETDPDPSVVEYAETLRRAPATPRPAGSPVATPPRASEALEPPAVAAVGAEPPAVEHVADERPEVVRASAPTRRPGRRTMRVAALAVVAAGVAAVSVASRSPRSPGGVGPAGVVTAARVATAGPAAAITLASGEYGIEDRDAASRLVACEGPACPDGPLPQSAFTVPTHVYHHPPVRGTTYIAPVHDGTSRPSPGYPCCTRATFERQFILPPEATSATITVAVHADNQALVAINGVEFGRQRDSVDTANYEDSATVFTHTFTPDPSGTNRLQVTLWDAGGALAVHYRAVVTHSTAADPDRAKRNTSIGWDARIRREGRDSASPAARP